MSTTSDPTSGTSGTSGPDVAPGAGAVALLELGTNSLKLHVPSAAADLREPLRAEWEIGYEVYAMRLLSQESIDSAVDEVRRILDRARPGAIEGLFGVATGVFEEAENVADLLGRLDSELDIPVRVLSGAEQARLLFLAFRERVLERPAMVFDLGCGRLEAVYLGAGGQECLHDSLALGVLRVHHLASFHTGQWSEEAAVRYIRTKLQPALRFPTERIHGTGGTVRVIAQVAGTSELTLDVLDRVETEARTHGPPRFLSARRQAIYLTGLVVLRHLVAHAGARVVEHHRVDQGRFLIERLHALRLALGSTLRDVFARGDLDFLGG